MALKRINKELTDLGRYAIFLNSRSSFDHGHREEFVEWNNMLTGQRTVTLPHRAQQAQPEMIYFTGKRR